ncbi:MAG: TfoX/Sxy family protein [Cyclobacteriaceae bacterium]
MPYTSANGHMFSLLSKDGELGFRFSKEVQEKYIEEWDSNIFKSYNAVMRGYVLVPDSMLEDLDTLAKYLNESYDHVMSLEPK